MCTCAETALKVVMVAVTARVPMLLQASSTLLPAPHSISNIEQSIWMAYGWYNYHIEVVWSKSLYDVHFSTVDVSLSLHMWSGIQTRTLLLLFADAFSPIIIIPSEYFKKNKKKVIVSRVRFVTAALLCCCCYCWRANGSLLRPWDRWSTPIWWWL